MSTVDRRAALRGLLCVTFAAGCGVTLRPSEANAIPLALSKDLPAESSNLKQKAQVGLGPPPRPLPERHRRRRRRRWECWWRRGRRICGYRHWR